MSSVNSRKCHLSTLGVILGQKSKIIIVFPITIIILFVLCSIESVQFDMFVVREAL